MVFGAKMRPMRLPDKLAVNARHINALREALRTLALRPVPNVFSLKDFSTNDAHL